MGTHAWSSVGIEEFLSADSRPSFVIEHPQNGSRKLNVVYRNDAFLREFSFSKVHGQKRPPPEDAYQESNASSFLCETYLWTVTIIRDRWRIVSRNACNHHKSTPREYASPNDQFREDPDLFLWKRNYKIHDWTAINIPPGISSWSKSLRAIDWSRTPLGPIARWPPQLRVMANLVCMDPNPAVLWWGQTMASLYNESYLRFVRNKHPEALGKPYRTTWEEIYAIPETAASLNEIWNRCVNGEATKQEFMTYFILRDTKLEEHIFHLNMLPIIGENGEMAGIYQQINEITDEQIRNRRLSTLISMADLTAGEEEPCAFFTRVIESLKSNTYDIPFAILYSVGRSKEEHNTDARRGPNSMYLEGFLGVSKNSDGVPAAHESLMSDEGFLSLVGRAIATSDLVQYDLKSNAKLQQQLKEHPSTRGFGDSPESAILCPIQPRVDKGISGVLILGLNTRRPYDEEYSRFFHTLCYSISTSLESILVIQEQKQLAKAASEKTLQALTFEQQAKAMLDMAPVGCFLISLEGKILYANDSWREITGYKGKHTEMSWCSVIHDEDHPKMGIEWSKLVDKRLPVAFELQLKKAWEASDPVTKKPISGPTYIILAASPRQIGNDIYITGAITDISRQKWVEGSEIRQRKEALELKRQQENFIDMTSHEMRNPLSAIFQCSDLIVAVLTRFQASRDAKKGFDSIEQGVATDLEDPIAAAIDAANTITLCAQHQKRIVDDVLCLSKIDSKLIQITPIDVQPRIMIENALKIFSAELAANKTQMGFIVEASFAKLEVDWVKLDPARLLQILINLCTNAIKFTSESSARDIRVTLGASSQKPTRSSSGVEFLHLPAELEKADPTRLSEWGQGDIIYLHIAVHDTGKGMNAEETKLLFQRFSQVSPRTHTKYGGSGLGLFIARLLAQLQGGEIGVSSTPSKGTTFAFYIKVRQLVPKATPSSVPLVPETNVVPTGSIQVTSRPALERAKNGDTAVNILVVEDNLVNQKVLSRQLRTLGFHVDVANNGQEAITFVQTTCHWKGNEKASKELTLILMDIEMPIMTGIEATRCIRDYRAKGDVLCHIPIIAITANARLEQIEAVRECGMDEVVSKPFRIPELIEKIEKFVGPIDPRRL